MSNNNTQNNSDSKKITSILILIATLMVVTTGSTYAYFAISATSNTTITGTAASGDIAFQLGNSATANSGQPSLVVPVNSANYNYSTFPMVPQKSLNGTTNVLQKAVTGVHPNQESGSTVYQCVDSNGNAICRVYTFTIRNNATSSVVVNGRIYFDGITTFPNLKWALMTSATNVTVSSSSNIRTPLTSANCTTSTSTSTTNCWFEVSKTLKPSGGASVANAAAGSYQQYWIVVWIEETGTTQTDSGTWTATVAFTSSNGTGITSTITS